MRIIISFFLVLMVLVNTSCVTLLSGTNQDIYIYTAPENTDIYVNGFKEAVGPGEITVSKNYSAKKIEIKKDGYENVNFELIRKFDPLALLNIIGMWGFIVDGATGAIMKFEKVYYDVEMEPIQKEVAVVKTTEDTQVKEVKEVEVSEDAVQPEEEIIKIVENSNDENPTFFIVEEMPEFPGGDEALRDFISNSVQYPKGAQNNGIQGRVYVQFVVDTDGSIKNVKIARGVHSSLNNEAMRVVKSMPNWKPGVQRGKPVRVSYTVPINFELTRNGEKKKK